MLFLIAASLIFLGSLLSIYYGRRNDTDRIMAIGILTTIIAAFALVLAIAGLA
jgi:hypothetical protein